MKSGCLLSVCITTRNRARYLAETLENILAQCTNEVEVVVVDGASTDETVAMVTALAARHPQLRLVVATSNSGLDADFDRAVVEARGRYCWLFSDDDLLAPGAIAAVLAACRQEPTVVIVDASVHDAGFTQTINERRLARDGRRVFETQDGEALFRECIDHLSFIGAVVVRRDFWMSRERARYFGSEFIHCGVLFQAPIPGQVIVVREPLVRIRAGIGNWMSRWFEVWGVKWPRLLWSFDWIAPAVRAEVKERELWSRFDYLLASRANRRYGWKQFRHVVVPAADTLGKLIMPALVVAVPWWAACAAIAANVRFKRVARLALGRR